MSQPGAADRILQKEEEELGGGKRLLGSGMLGSLFMGEVPLRTDQSERRMLVRLRGGTEMTLG